MNSYHPYLQRLVDAARRAPDDRDVAAPYGFAARVAALAMAVVERPMASVFERISLRAMGIACLLAVAAVAANYSSIVRLFQDEAPPVADDPVAALVDIAS